MPNRLASLEERLKELESTVAQEAQRQRGLQDIVRALVERCSADLKGVHDSLVLASQQIEQHLKVIEPRVFFLNEQQELPPISRSKLNKELRLRRRAKKNEAG